MSVLVSDSTKHRAAAPCTGPHRQTSTASAADRWLDSAPFRAHVAHVMATSGLTTREIAALTHVPVGVIRRLLQGRAGRPVRRIDPVSARRLYAVTPLDASLARSRLVAAGPARAQVLILTDLGRTVGWLARVTGLAAADVRRLAAGELASCPQIVELRLTAAVVELDARSVPDADEPVSTSPSPDLISAA